MAQEFQMFRKIKGLNSVTARQACEIPDCEKSIWGMTMLSPGQKLGLLAKRSVTSLFFLFFWERERWLDIQDGIRCLGMWRRAWRTVSCNPVLKASINQWEFEKGYLWRTQLSPSEMQTPSSPHQHSNQSGRRCWPLFRVGRLRSATLEAMFLALCLPLSFPPWASLPEQALRIMEVRMCCQWISRNRLQ